MRTSRGAEAAEAAPERAFDDAIELTGVVKRFGSVTAVDGLDLDVPRGTCLGLLGPNGAGKSTTMKLLTGQAIADEGRIRVLGHELPGEAKIARGLMGVVPQLDNLDIDVTVEENLSVFARLYRVPDVEEAVERSLKLARLEGRRRDAVDELSGGMRRRLLLARGLVHQPKLILLDEPTVGLDPQIRTELWSLIDALREAGTTILMSTHYIEEAEEMADRIGVISKGRLVVVEEKAALMKKLGKKPLSLHLLAPLAAVPEALAGWNLALKDGGNELEFTFDASEDGQIFSLLKKLQDAGIGFKDLQTRQSSLEDIFVSLVHDGKGARAA